VISFAASIPPEAKASSTLFKSFLVLVVARFKVTILSKATARPRIKQINTGVMKTGSPSINFSLITWWKPCSSSTISSSTTVGVAAGSSATVV
jgi:hypothetical protein